MHHPMLTAQVANDVAKERLYDAQRYEAARGPFRHPTTREPRVSVQRGLGRGDATCLRLPVRLS